MKVSMNYTTRKMIILDQIRGFNEENLVDDIEITVPAELSGFNIAIVFAQGDDTPIGATTLELGWTSGVLIYSVPAQLTTFNHIKFQILAAHPTTQAIWKSQIGHIYFEEPLPYIGDIPFTELSPYPDWLLAIEAANAAAANANQAAISANEAATNANEAALTVEPATNAAYAAVVRIEEVEAAIITNEASRQEIYENLLAVNGIVFSTNGSFRAATKDDIDAGTLDGHYAYEFGLSAYIHYQNIPSNIWSVNHNRNSFPSVTIIDQFNNVFFGETRYIDFDNLEITFSKPTVGKAYVV